MKQWMILAATLVAPVAFAETCEGGLYLNPQAIRGEGSAQAASAAGELMEFLRPTGLSVAPVVNVSSLEEVAAALKRRTPPCWVYGNPVVGFASGYGPVAVNMESIRAAVLVIGDVGDDKDPKPVELAHLPKDAQARVLAKLHSAECLGMRVGVTTALVRSEKICAKVTDVPPQQGLGQSYLPTKAAFQWQPERWVGLVTRLQSAQAASMKSHVGADPRIHRARLIVVPTVNASWGYGLYLRPDTPADVTKRAAKLFAGLRNAHPTLLNALDVGKNSTFATPPDGEVDAMRKVLDTSL